MNRSFDTIIQKEWDVLVIGGGITGAGIAWESASRGLKTALVEKGDFGAAASSGCFKIVHGGIRYLQHFDFKRLAESVREQKFLRRAAPHLVHPFPFLVPCYGYSKKSRPYIALGAFLYDFITTNRNIGVDDEHILPHPRILSRDEVLQIAPGLPTAGLTGGVVFYDCSIYNCERLSLSVIESAVESGAHVANYAEVVGFNVDDKSSHSGKIERTMLQDRISGRRGEVKSRLVVNAAGPWIPVLNKMLSEQSGKGGHLNVSPSVAREKVYSKGVQVVLPNIIEKYALAIESSQSDYSAIMNRGTRSYFLVPWRDKTLLGTSEQLFSGDPDTYSITKTDVEDLLTDAKRGYQSQTIESKNVLHVFGGLRQLDSAFFVHGQALGEAPPSKVDQLIDYEDLGCCNKDESNRYNIENLISVGCVKYTTFRSVAERAVNIISKKLACEPSGSVTANAILSGGMEDWVKFRKEIGIRLEKLLPKFCAQRIICEFGAKADRIASMIENDRSAGSFIGHTDVTRAELFLSLRSEMPQTLIDLTMRRTALGIFGYPGDDAIEQAANYCASELNWDDNSRIEQITTYKRSLYVENS